MVSIIEKLLKSEEPSVSYKIRVKILGEDNNSNAIRNLRQEIKTSSRVTKLLSECSSSGKIPINAYSKWRGAHWVLSILADIGYPEGDTKLIPLRDQVLDQWLSQDHLKRVQTVNDLVRRCASQEGNAIWSVLTLGLGDERIDELAYRLMKWQWPDGGWNCDKNPDAKNSSFHESLIPLRALSFYAKKTGRTDTLEASKKAAEIFLKRHLFKKCSDGGIINDDFVNLHYPHYWHYDFLFSLVVMAEAGFIDDKRCKDALDLLESKRLPDGCFPAEGKYYKLYKGDKPTSGCSLVGWGPTNSKSGNEFVTAEALFVLKLAKRI